MVVGFIVKKKGFAGKFTYKNPFNHQEKFDELGKPPKVFNIVLYLFPAVYLKAIRCISKKILY